MRSGAAFTSEPVFLIESHCTNRPVCMPNAYFSKKIHETLFFDRHDEIGEIGAARTRASGSTQTILVCLLRIRDDHLSVHLHDPEYFFFLYFRGERDDTGKADTHACRHTYICIPTNCEG